MDSECEIIFVGSKNGMENKLVPRASYPIIPLDVIGIKRSLSLKNITAVYKAARSTAEAKKLLLKLSPDAVIGTGGYVCYPILKAASKMGIYTAIHESNAVPGLAVKMLKNKVKRIFVSFDACSRALGVNEKCLYTGNPIKAEFDGISKDHARKMLGIDDKYRYLLVSFGGSLGAKTVNSAALEIMDRVTSKRGDVLHIHGCGKNGGSEFFKEFKRRGFADVKSIRASEYIYDMPLYLKAADIVVCRSGAMTLSEISASGVASVLIPSPNVTGNHQYKNALEFSSANAAFAVDETKPDAIERAVRYVCTLLSNTPLREQMGENAKKLSRTDSADLIAAEILNAIKKDC